jgi:molybdopterin synthase catalytic subunit
MKEIGEDVHRRWPAVRQVAMVHRVGRLAVGETSVIIAVSAAHRHEAF